MTHENLQQISEELRELFREYSALGGMAAAKSTVNGFQRSLYVS